jgi:hypothetical protein
MVEGVSKAYDFKDVRRPKQTLQDFREYTSYVEVTQDGPERNRQTLCLFIVHSSIPYAETFDTQTVFLNITSGGPR